MERNGGAQETPFPNRNTAKGTLIGAAIVQESMWKAKLAMLSLDPLLQRWQQLLLPHQHQGFLAAMHRTA